MTQIVLAHLRCLLAARLTRPVPRTHYPLPCPRLVPPFHTQRVSDTTLGYVHALCLHAACSSADANALRRDKEWAGWQDRVGSYLDGTAKVNLNQLG